MDFSWSFMFEMMMALGTPLMHGQTLKQHIGRAVIRLQPMNSMFHFIVPDARQSTADKAE
jgi:hypothetical protein